MSKSLNKLKDMLCDEIDSIAEHGELTAGSLETVDKLTHSLKSIESIMTMEDAGYSNAYPMYYDARPYRMYSRAAGHHMTDRLRDMLDDAETEKERTALRECIKKLEG